MVNKLYRFALLLACLALPLQAATQLKASVDKNPAMYGESVLLQVQVDEKTDAGALDFAVLEKDFRVSGPSVSQSMQIINGQSSQSTSWQLSLFPRRTGTLTIPAFKLGQLASTPITLEVLPASAASGKGAEIFLENSFSATTVYVQQMLYYEIKIYFKGELQRGSLSQPEMAGADIEQVGKDVENSEIVNGERYQTITRRYSIVPQKSGELTLSAPFFKGEMIDRDQSRYDYFARTKEVASEGSALTLNVNPVPAGQQPWLASELVALSEEWSPNPPTLVQGEPVTRTITLTALDLADHQLPDLPLATVDGAKIYPEQPQSRKAERKGRIVAQKVFSYAVIADKAGTLTLPAVKVSWWNTNTNQAAEAELPAVTLQVAANPNQPEPATVLPGQQVPVTTAATTTTEVSGWAFSYSSWLLLALWLLTLSLWFWSARPKAPAPAATQNSSELRFNAKKLRHACQQNDSQQATTQLLRWGRQVLAPSVQRLSDLVMLLPEGALRQQIQLLSYQGYQPAGSQWQGHLLLEAWVHYQHQPAQTDAGLSPLYPGR